MAGCRGGHSHRCRAVAFSGLSRQLFIDATLPSSYDPAGDLSRERVMKRMIVPTTPEVVENTMKYLSDKAVEAGLQEILD